MSQRKPPLVERTRLSNKTRNGVAKGKDHGRVRSEDRNEKKVHINAVIELPITPWPHQCKWRLHPSNWSSWLRLTRVCSWIVRFVNNCRSPDQECHRGPLSPEEVEHAQIRIIREAQQAEFPEEYHDLSKNKPISKKSCLTKLSPRMDEDGLIRCDGRLRFPEFLPYDMRFPIILPRGNWTSRHRNKPHPCKPVDQVLDSRTKRRNPTVGK